MLFYISSYIFFRFKINYALEPKDVTKTTVFTRHVPNYVILSKKRKVNFKLPITSVLRGVTRLFLWLWSWFGLPTVQRCRLATGCHTKTQRTADGMFLNPSRSDSELSAYGSPCFHPSSSPERVHDLPHLAQTSDQHASPGSGHVLRCLEW